jgi:sugar (pentulose or hexulose) kinase
MQYVIGFDIRSQSLKAVLISAEGKICGEASANYPIEYPQPTWAQQSPAAWMHALIQSVRSTDSSQRCKSQANYRLRTRCTS